MRGLVKKRKEKYMPRLKVWRLREECIKQKLAQVLNNGENKIKEAQNVEGKYNAMKEVWLKGTEQVCGWTKGPPRHHQTWWWNEEAGKAIEEKEMCCSSRGKNETGACE